VVRGAPVEAGEVVKSDFRWKLLLINAVQRETDPIGPVVCVLAHFLTRTDCRLDQSFVETLDSRLDQIGALKNLGSSAHWRRALWQELHESAEKLIVK